ncbi:hypothetical protein ABT369_38765 [Dactylosporangium sp. NPDC000244]|uniref:hypothetical protein n=1 Tax=Dactylosporangium sp. NPDC000244 TaxID=3154365 RepID=UPI00331B7326
MTAQVWRTDPATGLQRRDEDDGCKPGNHRRDALCARTRVETLPRDDQSEDDRGGAT